MPASDASGADQPAAGVEADVSAVHIGIERRTDRFDDLRASSVVDCLKDAAERTEPGQIPDQLRLRKGAGNVDRLDVDVGPAALLQDAVHPAAVSEGELPGGIRLAIGDVRQERRGGARLSS